MWDPGKYRQFGKERSRPFYELVSRIGAAEPARVVDLGCGPGELTADLCRRWPSADALGIDSSAEMIEAADSVRAGLPADLRQRLRFELADVTDWQPVSPVDVIVSNALLQWIPEHEKLLPLWVNQLSVGGWLAFGIPGNYEQPTHALLRQLAGMPRWRSALKDVAFNRQAADPAEYLDMLAREGCDVDAWETTYLHLLPAEEGKPHPVLAWMEGTALRPVKAALAGQPEQLWEDFRAQLTVRLAVAYPVRHGVVAFPFRRIFVVARKR